MCHKWGETVAVWYDMKRRRNAFFPMPLPDVVEEEDDDVLKVRVNVIILIIIGFIIIGLTNCAKMALWACANTHTLNLFIYHSSYLHSLLTELKKRWF